MTNATLVSGQTIVYVNRDDSGRIVYAMPVEYVSTSWDMYTSERFYTVKYADGSRTAVRVVDCLTS